MDYKYLTEILFYALLFVFKSSKKEFPFLSFQDFIIVFISKNTPLHSKNKKKTIFKPVILVFSCFSVRKLTCFCFQDPQLSSCYLDI